MTASRLCRSSDAPPATETGQSEAYAFGRAAKIHREPGDVQPAERASISARSFRSRLVEPTAIASFPECLMPLSMDCRRTG